MSSDATYRDPNSAAWINPYDFPKAWRYIILDDYLSPGVCLACAGSNPRKWDKRDGSGQSGATIVYNGDGLAEFSATIQLGWRASDLPTPQEQFAEWDSFKQLLKPPAQKGEGARAIFHPNLSLLPVPITTVVVVDVLGPKMPLRGIFEWEIKFQQYRAAKPAGTSPNGSKSSDSKSSGDAYDALIGSLTDQVEDLAK